MSAETETAQQRADDALKWFHTTKRQDSEETIWVTKEGAPEDLREMVREAHQGLLPDDWKYRFIVDSLDYLADGNDPDDWNYYPPDYTSERLEWLSSHLERVAYVDEACGQAGFTLADGGIVEMIAYGMAEEASEVFHAVREWVTR